MAAIAEREDGVLVEILVTPRASRSRIEGPHGERIKVAVTAPPSEGAANTAVAELFAAALALRRGAVDVIRGHNSRRKTLRIAGVARARVEEAIE